MRKVYCTLRGGFGNQLFQVAHGLALARRYGAELVLDDGWFRGRRLSSEMPRAFALGWFDLPCRLPSRRERPLLAFMDGALKLQKRLKGSLLPLHFDQLPLSATRLQRERWVFVHGCWQVHALMSPFRSQLQQQLRFRAGTFSDAHQQQLTAIANDPESVAVHVRRGDYVSNPRTAAAHGVCGLPYYARALAEVRRHLRRPHIHLFSDDLPWALDHLPLQGLPVTALDSSRQESADRLDLAEFDRMRHCRHAVIANSSFSWWAAFLLQTSDSLVIAPKQWFAWGSPSELYAPDWLLL
jgi:hypothetical protein